MSKIRHSTGHVIVGAKEWPFCNLYVQWVFKWNQSEGRKSGPLKIRWQFSWMENVPDIEDLQIGITLKHI